MYQGVVVVVTPCTKVWWLLYTMYQGVVVVVHHVPSVNVAQLKIKADHFTQRHQKKDVQKLLQEILKMSGGSEMS